MTGRTPATATAAARHDIATQLVHAGELARVHGAAVLPAFMSSTFSGADYEYLRPAGTPNHEVCACFFFPSSSSESVSRCRRPQTHTLRLPP